MRCVLSVLAWWFWWTVASTAGHQGSALPGSPYPRNVTFPKLSKSLIFTTISVLNEDLQVSAVVPTGNVSRYFHLHGAYGPLTLIIRPCTGSINATVSHVPQSNSSGFLKDYIQGRSESSVAMARGSSQHVFSWMTAPAGLYLLDLVAELRDTPVTLYATNLPGLPAVLRIKQQPRVRIQPRLHRNRVTLRWDQSMVDPQMMHYYVVVNSRYNFSSLCEASAQSAAGMKVEYVTIKPTSQENKIQKKAISDSFNRNSFKTVGKTLGKDDILITHVGSGLSFTINNLQKGIDYYFNIFAENHQTQLSFLYGNAALKYDPKLRPIGLRDNKPETINIRKLGGRALFRYKVRAGQGSTALNLYVMPCGGAVQAEVRLRREVIIPRLTIEGYQHLQVPNAIPGQRYTLVVHVPDAQQMRQILGVEVLATTRTSLMPQLPAESMVYEFPSMRTCESITVAWLPTSTQSVRYCVSASPVPVTESEAHFRPRPNQCNLDNRLRTQFDFAVKQCQDFSANDHRTVLVQTISKLRPGKEYLIQVTVKKIKGKALSYDLLRVRTRNECDV